MSRGQWVCMYVGVPIFKEIFLGAGEVLFQTCKVMHILKDCKCRKLRAKAAAELVWEGKRSWGSSSLKVSIQCAAAVKKANTFFLGIISKEIENENLIIES